MFIFDWLMGNLPDLISVTCNNCGKKIAEVRIKDGVFSIICPKCGVLNIQETKPTKERPERP